jgi:hypothetical protein
LASEICNAPEVRALETAQVSVLRVVEDEVEALSERQDLVEHLPRRVQTEIESDAAV